MVLQLFRMSIVPQVAAVHWTGDQNMRSLHVWVGAASDSIRTTLGTMRSCRLSLLLWAACTGLVSATWVCGGNVEITKSYDNKNIEGHCTGDYDRTA